MLQLLTWWFSGVTIGALKVWHDCGVKISLSPISSVFDKTLCEGFNDQSPQYSLSQTVRTGNSIYDVLYWFAKGYRSVGVATVDATPYRVTHIITGLQLVEFLRLRPDVLGSLYRLPLKRTRLMKRAITVKSTMNLGTAIQVVGKYNVDAAVILDEHKKVCGRFSASIVQDIYWQWRLTQGISRGKMLQLSECQAKYESNMNANLFNMNTIADEVRNGINNNLFNNFSCFSHPLKLCETLGNPTYSSTL